MRRLFFQVWLIILTCCAVAGYSQDTYTRPIGELLRELRKVPLTREGAHSGPVTDARIGSNTTEQAAKTRADILLELGLAYVLKPGEATVDLDSAFLLTRQAESINNELRDPYLSARIHYTYSFALRENKRTVEGKEHIVKAIEGYQGLNPVPRLQLGEAYLAFGRYQNYDIVLERDEEARLFYLALQQFKMAGIKERMAYACKLLGDMQELKTNDDSAVMYRREALAIYTAGHIKPIECVQLTLKICPLNIIQTSIKPDEPDTAYAKREDLLQGLHWTQLMNYYKTIRDTAELREAQRVIVDGLVDVGQTEWYFRHVAMSESIYAFAIEFGKTVGMVKTTAYYNACFGNISLGRLYTALQYGLEGVKMVEKYGNPDKDPRPEFAVGRVYYEMGKWNDCLEYTRRSIAWLRSTHQPINSQYITMGVKAYLMQHQGEQALQFLQEHLQSPMPAGYYKKVVTTLYGDCYLELKDYSRAEKYYKETYNDTLVADVAMRPMASLGLATIYFQTGQYRTAPSFLKVILDGNRAAIPLSVIMRAHLLKAQVDSALGDYTSAIAQLHMFRTLNDSFFSATKNRQIEELNIQYEISKKDQNISLLTQQGLLQTSQLRQAKLEYEIESADKKHELDMLALQAEKKEAALRLLSSEADRKGKDLQLKEQNIELLTKQGEIQAGDLSRNRLLKNGLLAGAIMLVLLLALLYNRYNIKRKNNSLLLAQQKEISHSNIRLQQLNASQQKLLSEKEWLLKEVHHRVKNNLQIIISLLNIQSEFLHDEKALNAMKDVSARIRAISLIHQKLYLNTDIATINMPTYVTELVNYLKETYLDRKPIHFTLQIDPIDMDVAQSVPLGLILSEAITNSIKYAFEGRDQGRVMVSLLAPDEKNLELTIADNGRGLPAGWDIGRQSSMGFGLIQMLVVQLQGSLRLESSQGLQIAIRFPREVGMAAMSV